MIVRSKAPLRISFAGGGTDVPPYSDERGGVVLSATIDKYAYASLRLRDDSDITVQSLDYDVVAHYHADDELQYDGELDLVKAVLRSLNNGNRQGLDFFLHSDAPPGSGLGSSSTMVVALIGALKHYRRLPLTDYEIAELAYRIERKDLGIQGGMQDQYAAAFGGFNFMEFSRSAVIVNPLRIEPDVVNELQYNLLLCYTGTRRLSARIIQSQVAAYERREEEVLRAMDELKHLTLEIKNALLQGRLADFGALYGSLGALMALLLFVYAAAIVLLFGAEFASEWTRLPPDDEVVREVRGLQQRVVRRVSPGARARSRPACAGVADQ